MSLFESNIDLFHDYTGTLAAEVTACFDVGDGAMDVYFTVIHRPDSDDIEVYDMKEKVLYMVEGTFIGVCTLLGLSLDPRELDLLSSRNETIKPVDAEALGSYILTIQDGKWVDYDFDDRDSQDLVEPELKNLWEDYQQDPERLTIYKEN